MNEKGKLLLIGLTITFVVYSSSQYMTFTRQMNDLCPLGHINRVVSARSQVQCSSVCLAEYSCLGFCYNPTAKRCKTSNSTLPIASANALSDPGYTMLWKENLDGYSRFGGMAYKVFPNSVIRNAARTTCANGGSQLVIPKNQNEMNALATLLQLQVVNTVWSDINDEAQEGVWIDSST
ncbi:hypothetical protein SK128_023334, partial [Halocaridina rubra]